MIHKQGEGVEVYAYRLPFNRIVKSSPNGTFEESKICDFRPAILYTFS